MKSKIDIYNATMIIVCAAAITFSAAARDNIALRVVCAVAAVANIIGIIIKIVKGGTDHGRDKA